MNTKGFLGSLFDYSFNSFVTSRIVKFLYVLTTVVVAAWALVLVLFAFHLNKALGALSLLVLGPIFFLVTMTYARVGLELMIVFFRISENVSEINARTGAGDTHRRAADPEAHEVAVAVAAPVAEAQPRTCANCAAIVAAGNSFCQACGSAVS
jgi:hypothetical protein